MEKLEALSFRDIVGELLRRHQHGICAFRADCGEVRYITTGRLGAKLGLTSLIQHRLCTGELRTPTGPVASTETMALHDLELVATDHLIELLRGFAEDWILGLAREARMGDRLVPTVACKGSALTCVGLAAMVAHLLCHQHRERHRESYPVDSPDEPLCWLTKIHDMVSSDPKDQTWMLGLARAFEFSLFARGEG